MDARAGRLVDAPRYLASLVTARGRLRLLGGCLDAWPGRSAHGAGPGLPSCNLGPAITHRIAMKDFDKGMEELKKGVASKILLYPNGVK